MESSSKETELSFHKHSSGINWREFTHHTLELRDACDEPESWYTGHKWTLRSKTSYKSAKHVARSTPIKGKNLLNIMRYHHVPGPKLVLTSLHPTNVTIWLSQTIFQTTLRWINWTTWHIGRSSKGYELSLPDICMSDNGPQFASEEFSNRNGNLNT